MLNSLKCLIQCLEQTISPDKNVLAEAQTVLEKCAQENMGQFISNMSIVIADPNNSPIARQAAGLQLKNCLTVRDVVLKKECQQRWSNLEEETRIAVRERLISTLGTEDIRPSCAAQCLAYIGAAELFPGTQQSSSQITSLENLLSELSHMVIKPTDEHSKEAVFECIAYICQEIKPSVLVNFYPSILNSIKFCMEDSKSTGRIRLAAAHALLGSLACISPEFDTEEGRNAIMQVVCDGAQSSDVEESVISLEILVKIGSFYYHHLENYMESFIVPITLKAMASTDSDVALQGMEFWCSVAEIEFNLASGAYDPALVVPSSFYAEKALPKLVPVLMSALVVWQDDPNDIDDFEDWTPFKGACSCLMLLAECCSNSVAAYVTPQIGNYITRSDWRYPNAALWALGSILEELDPERTYSEISPFMANVWESIHERTSAKVRYAAHVLMGRIFEFCPHLIPSALRQLIKGLLVHLEDDDHRVAAAACKTFSSLVRVIYKLTSEKEEDGARQVLTSFPRYYNKIVKKLLQCSGKFREHQKCAAQEVLVDVLLNAPDDCYVTVKRTIQTLMGTLRYEVATKENENDFPYALLSRAMSKLKAEEIQMRHEFMHRLISLLQSESPRGVVKDKEDVFLAISKTISLLSLDELKVHLPALISYFKLAAESRDPCPAVVSLIGDLFCALGTESLPYLDGFCLNFFDLIARNKIPTKLRSSCVATLTDIANSVGVQNFWPYIACTLNQLEYASSITVKNDPEHEELQDKMLQLYACLFIFTCEQVSEQSSENPNQELNSQLSVMKDCLAGFSELMVAIVDEDTSDRIIIASAEFVGIIVDNLGIDAAMKYLKSNLNLKWLVSSAVHRADNSRESNSAFSEPRFAMLALEAFNAVE